MVLRRTMDREDDVGRRDRGDSERRERGQGRQGDRAEGGANRNPERDSGRPDDAQDSGYKDRVHERLDRMDARLERLEQRLEKLKGLLDKGLISQTDYDAAKAEVLKKLMG